MIHNNMNRTGKYVCPSFFIYVPCFHVIGLLVSVSHLCLIAVFTELTIKLIGITQILCFTNYSRRRQKILSQGGLSLTIICLHFSFPSTAFRETARYILKYCFKVSLTQNNQSVFFWLIYYSLSFPSRFTMLTLPLFINIKAYHLLNTASNMFPEALT